MPGNRVGIAGVTGYLGGELARLLSVHPSLSLVGAVSRSAAGKTLADCCPYLPDGKSTPVHENPSELDCDLAFLALPSGEAMRHVPGLLERGIRVIDLSADYRLKDPQEYERTYGAPHADPEGLERSVYGLTEPFRDAIRGASLVANPGCYPTAFLLPALPLIRAGWQPEHLVVDAKSGTSGAGAAPTAGTHHPTVAGDVHPYGGGHHRHLPEIRQEIARGTGRAPAITFVPHLVPIVRGILCSIYAPGVSPEAVPKLAEVLASAYGTEPFVRIGPVPHIPWAVGSNRCDIGIEASEGAAVIFSVIDNLLKGGAGQAVQNANLMLGRPEAEGLPVGGLGL